MLVEQPLGSMADHPVAMAPGRAKLLTHNLSGNEKHLLQCLEPHRGKWGDKDEDAYGWGLFLWWQVFPCHAGDLLALLKMKDDTAMQQQPHATAVNNDQRDAKQAQALQTHQAEQQHYNIYIMISSLSSSSQVIATTKLVRPQSWSTRRPPESSLMFRGILPCILNGLYCLH